MKVLALLKALNLCLCMLVQHLLLQILKSKGIVYTPDHLGNNAKWSHAVDQGVYNGGGKAEGAYIAIAKVGKGKAAFIGDSSLVEDSSPKYLREDTGKTKKTYDGFKEEDNAQLLNNLTSWLRKNQHRI